MPVTAEEKSRCRAHLGYPQVDAVVGYQLGIPTSMPVAFLLELALNKLSEVGLDRFRFLLRTLDNLENQMAESTEFLVAEQLGDLRIRADFEDKLEGQYVKWAERLSDHVGVSMYPYAARFSKRGGGINIPVRR